MKDDLFDRLEIYYMTKLNNARQQHSHSLASWHYCGYCCLPITIISLSDTMCCLCMIDTLPSWMIYATELRDIFQCNVVTLDHIASAIYLTVECSCIYHRRHDSTIESCKKSWYDCMVYYRLPFLVGFIVFNCFVKRSKFSSSLTAEASATCSQYREIN